ncbi:PASTA domain-containing protein [Cellulosimicrobium cellulans]|uniref:PASTA domain-containing protein n=1 Tax=Cellulosimicrobium cellulans TaxID=1710 RepID=UPI000848BC27|nr:PASTA domain-containing protein [Cellulosimicrobium cellulans]
MRYVARRSAVVVTTVVAVALLGACKAPAFPGGPGEPGPTTSPTDSPTGEPTEAPTEEPTGEPTAGPTEEPTDDPTAAPGEPGSSDGVDVSVTIEPGYPMPNLVETSLKQARRSLEREGAATVTVVDARRGGEVQGRSNGWTVCSQEPAAGDFARASTPVVLAAAPNARHCP